MKHLRWFSLIFCAVLFSTTAALAEDDPPSRAVRLNYINGEVSVQPGGVDDWVPGAINRPLTTSDRVWTDKNSRAELHLGTSAMRLNGETSLTLTNVSDNNVQLRLDQGTLNLRVAQLYQGEVYEVNTPNLSFTVLKSGSYRFDVVADSTLVTVRKGEGEATSDGPGVRLRSQQQARFVDSFGRHQMSAAPGYDGFDDWCRVRDEREDRSLAVRYVPRGVVGYEDLDGYGRWETAPPYGHVWVPTSVVVGWAPYRYGHWIWVSPWGWTWVDDAPWGFAPFHYGRWIHHHRRWAWCPGPIVVRPYYAPALVAWVGGSHWGVGLSFGVGGGLGWFPLGYGEPYIPYYRGSRHYFRNVNVTNTRITNITHVTNNYYNNTANIRNIKYANVKINGAVTAVSQETLVRSRPVHNHLVNVADKNFKDSVMASPEARPSRESRLGARAGDHAAMPPRVAESRVRGNQEARHDKPDFANRKVAEKLDRGSNKPDRVAGEPGNSTRTSESKPDVARHVPRPPERGTRTDAGAKTDRIAGEKSARHEVPRPPSRSTAVKDLEERGRPSTPPPNRVEAARGPREPISTERAVPRPPKVERPVQASPKPQASDPAANRSQVNKERESPQSKGGATEARIEARPEPRPAKEYRAPQRQVAPMPERPAANYGRPVTRTPEVRHQAPAPRREAAPPAARQAGKAEARTEHRAQSQHHGGGERGKSQR
jgi:hypothetical protein